MDRAKSNQQIEPTIPMKITALLFALLLSATMTYAAEGDKPKPAEGDKPKPNPEEYFKKKDANGDGKLSKDEFTKGAKDAAKAETRFTTLDKDKDGSVTKEEFSAAPAKKKDK